MATGLHICVELGCVSRVLLGVTLLNRREVSVPTMGKG
jgi:hypothetical protein